MVMAKDILEYTLYLRKDKMDKKGRMPIYIRFPRIDGREAKFPMGKSIAPELWDEQNHCALDKKIAAYLKEQESRIYKEISKLQLDNREITKDELKNIVANKIDKIGDPRNHSFYAYFEDYITISRKKGLAESTLKVYETTLKSMKTFRSDIRVKDMSAKLIEDFDKFLIKRGQKSGKGDVPGSRYNRHKNIRTIVKYIFGLNVNIYNPWATREVVTPKYKTNDRFLEASEVKQLHRLLTDLTLEYEMTELRVLVMYLFACSTGLRISDALNLKWGDLVFYDDENGKTDENKLDIDFIVKKTGKRLRVPVFDLGIDMIIRIATDNFDRVESGNNMFYQYSPNTVNRVLKVVAKMAGIEEPITFHSARRTFATQAAAKGMPIGKIQRYLGHSSLWMTNEYIKHYDDSEPRIHLYDVHRKVKKRLKKIKLQKE